jgi:hypothetical protein
MRGEADSRFSKFRERASKLLCFGACLCFCVQVKHKNETYFVMITSDSSVDYALSYGIYDRGIRVRFLAGFYIFPQYPNRFPPASYPVFTGLLSAEVIWMDCEPDHLYQSKDEVKNVWSYIFIPPYVFMYLYGT